MALDFSPNSSRVDHGSDASLDNLNAATWFAWAYSGIALGNLASKETDTPNNETCEISLNAPGGDPTVLRFFRPRSTTWLQTQGSLSNFSHHGTGKWLFIAASYDMSGADGDQKLLIGDLNNGAAEPSSYNTQVAGSGTTDEAAHELLVGTNARQITREWGDRIALFGVVAQHLTNAQIRYIQFNPLNALNFDCRLFSHYGFNGTGTQADLSGNLNNGTVTNATQTDHVPLGPPFALSQYRVEFGWGAAGPETITRELQDTLSLTDGLARDFWGDRFLADALSLTDQIATANELTRGLQDTLSLTDQILRDQRLTRNLQDILTYNDQVVRDLVLTRLLQDVFTFTENLDSSVDSGVAETHTRTLVDTLSLTDSLSRDFYGDRLLNDAFSFAENLSTGDELTRQLQDAFTFAENLDRVRSLIRQINDTLSFTDQTTRSMIMDRILKDLLSLVENLDATSTGAAAVAFLHWRLKDWHRWAERRRIIRSWMDRVEYPPD